MASLIFILPFYFVSSREAVMSLLVTMSIVDCTWMCCCTRERTIHLTADSIRCRKISADAIPIRFAYSIAYFVRHNDDDGGHR